MELQDALDWCRRSFATIRCFEDHFQVEVYTTQNHYEAFRATTLIAAVAKARRHLDG